MKMEYSYLTIMCLFNSSLLFRKLELIVCKKSLFVIMVHVQGNVMWLNILANQCEYKQSFSSPENNTKNYDWIEAT